MRQRSIWILLTTAAVTSCSGGAGTAPAPRIRTYRMGFGGLPPKPTDSSYVQMLNATLPHADAAIFHESVPYAQLLAGISADSVVRSNELGIVNFYRSHGFPIVYEIDVTNGLNRAQEDPVLDSLGHSITEPAIQQQYRSYVKSVASILAPDVLGLASEVNLIEVAAPARVYAAVKQMTNAAAADVRTMSSTIPLYVSAQVETAWGRLTFPPGQFVGIDQLFADFPFITRLGLSSYPYLGQYTDPSQIPGDYYTRLIADHPIAVMVVEGGWPSASGPTFASSPALQMAYLARQRQLLDSAHAMAVFQLSFSDINLAAWQVTADTALIPFSTLGLLDSTLTPKPALATWDSSLARPYKPPVGGP